MRGEGGGEGEGEEEGRELHGIKGLMAEVKMGGSGRAKRAMPTSQNRDMGHPA